MGIGIGIFLIAVGAILTFAVEADVEGLNLDIVGWILMAAGVIGLLVTLSIWGRRRTVAYRRPADTYTVEERTDVPPDSL